MIRLLFALTLLSLSSATGQGLFTPALKQYGKTVNLTEPIVVKSGETFDGRLPSGKFVRYVADPKRMGDGSQSEHQKPMFILEPGAELSNLILDTPSADGVHLYVQDGKTTRLTNIQVRDVGEDAITVKEGSGGNVIISRCSFLKAADKVIQVNVPSNVLVDRCYAQDFVRFARSIGTGKNLDYRIAISESGFRRGKTILKMTNSRARGSMSNVLYEDIDNVYEVDDGATVEVLNVNENEEKKRGLFRKLRD